MARKPSGKPLALFPIRVDEDVKAVLLAFKASHDTINEGLRSILLNESKYTPKIEAQIKQNVTPRVNRIREKGDKTR